MQRSRFAVTLALTACALVVVARQAPPWQADMGDGTYRNPILYADYSDPDAIRVGADFYMTASSFSAVPGLPVLHSRDLVNWRLIGHALFRLVPESTFVTPQHGGGVWARRSSSPRLPWTSATWANPRSRV